MQAYGKGFAKIYNRIWAPQHATKVGPAIRGLYEATELGGHNRDVLDVCCGGGQMARYFLDAGYSVTGIDLSPSQLECARENAGAHLDSDRVTFLQRDATDFRLEDGFGLAVSTYDSLNHLDGIASLRRCLACIFDAVLNGGMLVFDLNTRLGLERRWNGFSLREGDDELVLSTALFDGDDRATVRFWGFFREEDGRYSRFEEFAYSTAYDLAAVGQAVLDAGWQQVHVAAIDDLSTAVLIPEALERAYVVAVK